MTTKLKRYDGTETYVIKTRAVAEGVTVSEKWTSNGRLVSEDSSTLPGQAEADRFVDVLLTYLGQQGWALSSK